MSLEIFMHATASWMHAPTLEQAAAADCDRSHMRGHGYTALTAIHALQSKLGRLDGCSGRFATRLMVLARRCEGVVAQIVQQPTHLITALLRHARGSTRQESTVPVLEFAV